MQAADSQLSIIAVYISISVLKSTMCISVLVIDEHQRYI